MHKIAKAKIFLPQLWLYQLCRQSFMSTFLVLTSIVVPQVLHSLTDGTEPSTELIATVKKLYEVKLQVWKTPVHS